MSSTPNSVGYASAAFVRSFISLMKAMNRFDKTDREYSLAPTDDLIRLWRSRVKVPAGR